MTGHRPQRASGYTLILPPGWLRLDARTDRGTAELDGELDRVLSTVPRDSMGPLIAQARKQAHAVLEKARTAGALDLYLPLGGMHGRAVPASFLVSMVAFTGPPPDLGAAQDPEATSMHMAAMLADRMPAGEVREMPAGIAVRSRRVLPADGDSEWAGTRVDYHWPMPSQPLKWALASFTTIGAGAPEDDVSELLLGLFDAIMLTWRWRPGLVI
ncbi:MAG: hypothetical protein QOF35_467 [Actinomycetota bacterium]|jgi:hypothetical protein|nr:hypothetical protein [Actinomycetota bacterium]